MRCSHARKVSVLLSLAACGCSTNSIDEFPLPNPMMPALTLATIAETRQIDLSSPLEGHAIAAIAVLTNPDLRAMRAREGVAEAQVFAAGLFPDPSFSLGLDYPSNGVGSVNALAASLGLDLAVLARRPAAMRGANAVLDAVRLDVAWVEWLVAEQAKIQALRIPYLERSKILTTQLRSLANDELLRSFAAMARGDLPAASLESRRLAAADAAARDRDVESLLARARLDLNRTLGLDPDQRIDIAVEATAEPSAIKPDDVFRLAVTRRADLQGMRASYEESFANQRLVALNRFPLPVVAVNGARDTGAIRTIGPSVSLTLPLWNRARGDMAIVNANRAQLRAEYVARLETVRADIASAHITLGIISKQSKEVANEIRPLATQADAVNRAVARGDLSQSAGVATRLTLLDKRIVENGLEMAVAESVVALEIAAGYPLEQEL